MVPRVGAHFLCNFGQKLGNFFMHSVEKTELVQSFQDSILLIKVDYLRSFDRYFVFVGPILTDG